MNWLLVVVGIIVVIFVVGFLVRYFTNRGVVRKFVNEMCNESGVPNVACDVSVVIRDVLTGKAGVRILPGEYWVAQGIEVIGDASLTRLMDTGASVDRLHVQQLIDEMFDLYGGYAMMPPHLAEGRFIGQFPGAPREVIYARVVGRMRPIGAWTVAIPASLVP